MVNLKQVASVAAATLCLLFSLATFLYAVVWAASTDWEAYGPRSLWIILPTSLAYLAGIAGAAYAIHKGFDKKSSITLA